LTTIKDSSDQLKSFDCAISFPCVESKPYAFATATRVFAGVRERPLMRSGEWRSMNRATAAKAMNVNNLSRITDPREMRL
jgi:hypothetical protein